MSRLRLTLVTYLFDLARREPRTARITAERYLERARKFVLGIDRDLVVFCDPELAGPIEESRSVHGLASRTHMVPLAFEELASYAVLSRIEAARAVHPLRNGAPDKDTPMYTVLGWAKSELAGRIARDDPFEGTHVAWIDIGLPSEPHPGEDPFAHPSDRIRLLQMRPLFEHELAPIESYLSQLSGHIAAGYVCGSRANMAWLGEEFARLALGMLEAGFAGSDEQLLPLLIARHRDRFEFHHGDYSEILVNYLLPHAGAENLSFQLRLCREHGVPEGGARLARSVCESVAAGKLEAEAEILATLLDDCYVAAWYGDPAPHPLARRIAELYLNLAERDPSFREVFLREEIHVRRNFSFLEPASGADKLSAP